MRRSAEGLDPSLMAALPRVLAPIGEAKGLPNQAYTSLDFAAFERDEILAKTWLCIGVGQQVANKLDVRPVEVMGLPLIMLRDREGALRVFHNVCSHRGMKLVAEPGAGAPVLRCPYHSWTYGLDGQLRATPFIGGPGTADCPGFERGRHGLKPVRSAVWCDAVFVDLSGDAPDFEDFIAPIARRWPHLDPALLRHGGPDSRFQLELACNWKLAVENFCEGYHLPWIHPTLNSYSRLEDHYNIEQEGAFAGQGSLAFRPQLSDDGRGFPHLPDLPDDWQGKAEYLALFPNVMFGLQADHLFTVVLEPKGLDRTLEHFEIYYVGEAALTADCWDLRAANCRQWRSVFEEDRFVVEGMQQGRGSPGFEGGVFSPVMDGPTHCFHKWVAGAALRSTGPTEVRAAS